jgi:hypothetical protein
MTGNAPRFSAIYCAVLALAAAARALLAEAVALDAAARTLSSMPIHLLL